MSERDKPTSEERQMIREFFGLVVDEALSDEDCDNIWLYGCSKPDTEMIESRKKHTHR